MDMIVPPIKQAGTYYLWPGLQDTGNTGVYQEVLDGRTGAWWIGAGWCCRFVKYIYIALPAYHLSSYHSQTSELTKFSTVIPASHGVQGSRLVVFCTRDGKQVVLTDEQAPVGSKVTISNTRDTNGVNWTATMNMGTSSTKDSFPLGYKNFNQVCSSLALLFQSCNSTAIKRRPACE